MTRTNRKLVANLRRAAKYLDNRPEGLLCPPGAFPGLFFLLADDVVTYHRSIRLMAKAIDPRAESKVERMSQLTLIVSKWFTTHTLDEQVDFLNDLANKAKRLSFPPPQPKGIHYE